MQQIFLGLGAVAKKSYIDDCFYTHVYIGNGSTSGQNITGSNFTPDLVWIKGRNHSSNNILVDSVRGDNKVLYSNTNDDEDTNEDYVNSRFEGGFKVGNSGITNGSNETNAGWTWKKQEGFFDVVTYTGNGSNQAISHSLGCIPGMIMVKSTSTVEAWNVYHVRAHASTPQNYTLHLNTTAASSSASDRWNNTAPTTTQFTVGSSNEVNQNGTSYVAYLFAGGESTAATARSVSFDSNGEYLSIPDSSDFDWGSTFTFEAWVKPDFSSNDYYNFFYSHGSFNISIGKNGSFIFDSNHIHVGGDRMSSVGSVPEHQWTHIAAVCSSGVLKLYVNGIHNQNNAQTGVNITGDSGDVKIGRPNNNGRFTGNISNLRIVKGTAVYTSSFRPPTEPLTNITNTVLLCCNNSSTTGSTVTPGTITANGSPGSGYPTASTDSPFDDPAGFVFGENEDQNVIKCGSYVGNGDADGPEIFLGFEPSWIMLKRTDSSENWGIFDTMRGIPTGGSDYFLRPNTNNDAATYGQTIELTPTGFKLRYGQALSNVDNAVMVYVAIRRSDGYVGKPPELGTDVFAMATGAGSSTIPNFTSNFPVDFAAYRQPASTSYWYNSSRLTAGKELIFDGTNAEGAWANLVFDSNTGWQNHSNHGSSYQSWMWSRGQGFDVVAFDGISGGAWRPHGLSKTPEMIWIKDRSAAEAWQVYHDGVNGGTNPEQYEMVLNTNAAQAGDANVWNNLAPTATHFRTGSYDRSGGNTSHKYIAMLFASVDKISKCGFYTGNGSATERTITLGFQPRFLIVKRADGTNNWVVFDTTRGWGSGNDKTLSINSTAEQGESQDIGAPTSTGFTLNTTLANYNANNSTYIYYAHA